jgi:hypothetical protein
MAWVIYSLVSNATWHYASFSGYEGLTRGASGGGSPAQPGQLVFNAGFAPAPVSWIQPSPITFSNKKNYLFETKVSNFAPAQNTNKLILKIGFFTPTGVDYWQGRSKYIEYGQFTASIYPPGNTRTAPLSTSNDVSESKVNVYQFFSKPTESFTSQIITGALSTSINGSYSIAEFQASKQFGDSFIGTNTLSSPYPQNSTNNNMSLIKNFSISELDFQVQGWAVYKEENYLTDLAAGLFTGGALGWAYFNGTYSWRVASTASANRLNAMGPVPDSGTYSSQFFNDSEADMIISSNIWTVNNFIGLPIEDGQIFNLQFDAIFSTQSGPNKGPDLKLYLSNELPTKYTVTPQRGLLIGTFTESNRYNFYNLNGGQYLYFVGGTAGTPGLNFVDIGNVSIKQGYSLSNNNKQFSFQSTSSPYSEPTQLSILGADPESTYTSVSITDTTVHVTDSGFVGPKKLTYIPPPVSSVRVGTPNFFTAITGGFNMVTIPSISITTPIPLQGFSTVGFFSNIYGTVSNLTEIRSKVGNGTFMAGVWENGVWNSGWRVDENVHEFNNISLSFNLKTENVRWRIQIEGPTYSVVNFEIGDRISIGNIVTIDINERRKLLKNYFTVVNKNETTLIVEVDNVFPIRRIQKDSPNHKILITKNVWLNGGFLNGYFEGIWNDGLFKGYPYITEMYNSHWIDGKFDGGHFYATKPSFSFEDTYYWEGYVGLTFGSVTHSFLPGDLITINKDDKSVNTQYDGDHTITKIIDEHLVVTDIQWGENTANESGIVSRRTSTGLIQNFTFYDNNKSIKTSKETRVLKDLWRYSSWIDVNYSDQSTTNINSDRIYNNKSTTNFLYWRDRHQFGIGDYAVLNLYGFVTDDVLSSESYFRGLDSVGRRAYSLGTKYEIYQDFLGDISNLNNPFDTDPELGTLDNFITDGWTWSFSGTDGGTYSYVNNLVTTATSFFNKSTDFKTSDYTGPQLFGGTPTWSLVPFQTTIEDTFGLLITASTSNNEWTVNTSGIYNINIEIPSSFNTNVVATPLETGIDNDYLFITGNVTVGQLRLVKYSNGSTSVLSSKTIKTTGGDFNVGTERYNEGQSVASYNKNLTLFIDWKGSLQIGDKVRLEFQSCQLAITNYNSGGPWRGSGFEQGFPLYDNIIYIKADWSFNANRTLSISNSGVNNSLGFNMRRTSDGTLLVEHLENSFHSLTLNNSNIKIAKNRYSMIEFDLIQSPETSYQPLGESYSFHWTDLYNFTTFINKDLSYSNQPAFPAVEILQDINIGGTYSSIRQNPQSRRALWSGIDYTKTTDTKKREFFYNRPGLDLGLLSEQRESFREQIHELDNIKFYEVDMIPFFQYTTEEYVDSGIKIPYQGKAPFIDYSNSDFSFIESVVIGLDSVDLQETATTYVSQAVTPFIFNIPPVPTNTLTPVSQVRT